MRVQRGLGWSDDRCVNALPSIFGLSGANRMLAFHQSTIATSLERLATGKKVNRASDNPSAIAPINEFKGRILEINKLLERFEFEESRLGATEGGLSVIQDLVLELKGLNITGANGAGLSEAEREGIRGEVRSVMEAIAFTTTNTFFNGNQVLVGQWPDLGGLLEAIDSDPERAQEIIDAAVDEVSGRRGAIGARLNSIGSERNVLLSELEGNAGALSAIEDTDYA